MKYAILRTQKLKSTQSIYRSMKHAFRAQETPNADPSRTPDNTHIGAQSVAESMAAFRSALPAKVRKNGVLCIEYLITASPEIMKLKSREKQDDYFDDALTWLRARHGKENVVYAGIHRDETTPHMYAYIVPKDPDTGRLNCRRFLGGAKALSQMQTDFYEKVAQQHGLERGIEGSKATHQQVKQFYQAINKPLELKEFKSIDVQPRVLKRGFLGFGKELETDADIAKRLTDEIKEQLKPHFENALLALLEQKRKREAITHTTRLKNRVAPLIGAIEGLYDEEVKQLGSIIQKESENLLKKRYLSWNNKRGRGNYRGR